MSSHIVSPDPRCSGLLPQASQIANQQLHKTQTVDTAFQLSSQRQHAAAGSYPQAVTVFCNGKHGIYLVPMSGVQCLCASCADSRRKDPNSNCWLVSPTEFERHCGMHSAKKWRFSIRVSQEGEPDIPLGRWLEMHGLSQSQGFNKANSMIGNRPAAAVAAAAASVNLARTEQVQQQQPQQQNAPERRDSSLHDQSNSSARQLGHLLAALHHQQQLLLQQQQQQQHLQEQQGNSSCLVEDQPHCTTAAHMKAEYAAADGCCVSGTSSAAAAITSAMEPQDPLPAAIAARAGAVSNRSPQAGGKLSAMRAAQMQLQSGAVDGLAHVTSVPAAAESCKWQQQQHQSLGGLITAAPSQAAAVAAAASEAAAEAEAAAAKAYKQQHEQQCKTAAPSLLKISCPSGEHPTTAAAAGLGYLQVDLEEAAAAAALGDDSLWLRSPKRRTPKTISTPHIGIPAAATAAAAGSSDKAAAAAAAVRLDLTQTIHDAAAVCKDTHPHQQQQLEDDVDMAEAAESDDDNNDHGADDQDIEECGIAVGSQHQADLPHLRQLPVAGAVAALVELRKAGRPGPNQAEALAIAIEEKARSDLLPRDAVEDVWQRSSGIALERAPRQRRAPGWQSAFVDPLKPYSLTGGQQQQQQNAGDLEGMTNAHHGAAGSSKKRAHGSSSSSGVEGIDQEQQMMGKRARYPTAAADRTANAGTAANRAYKQQQPCPALNCSAGTASGWATPLGFIKAPELLSWYLVNPNARVHAPVITSPEAQNPSSSPRVVNPTTEAQPSAAASPAAAAGTATSQQEVSGTSSDAHLAVAAAAADAAAPLAAAASRTVSPVAGAGSKCSPASADLIAAPLPAAAAVPGGSSSSTRGVVEVRIVLDGCIYVGRLQEDQRVEMARSRIPAAVEPYRRPQVHDPPSANAVCVLCQAPESPGCHADQATAAAATGMSSQGLGPLMPVTMGLLPAAAAAAGDQAQECLDVVWVHRQCALWSPEVYPDRRGLLMHLPMAITRGLATRCSRCGLKGATLKCADRSCRQQYHLDCARKEGCTLLAEPYTVTCPMHELPKASPEPASLAQQQQQQQQSGQFGPDVKLHCRTTGPLAVKDEGLGRTPPSAIAAAVAAAQAAADLDPMFDPDHFDSESDLTPLAGPMFGKARSAAAAAGFGDDDEEEMSAAAAVLLSGFKHCTAHNAPQSRLRHQSDDGTGYYHHHHHQQQQKRSSDNSDYHHHSDSALGHNRRYSSTNNARPSRISSRRAAAAAANRVAAAANQLHDSRGRFLSHAAAKAAQDAAAATAARAAMTAEDDGAAESGGSPWSAVAKQQQQGTTPAAAAALEADANGSSDMSAVDIPIIDGEIFLGGTTGQPGRAGRCAVCVVQRKGKCGTESAPKKCLRRMLQQQRKAQAAAAAAAAAQSVAVGDADGSPGATGAGQAAAAATGPAALSSGAAEGGDL